MTKRLLHLMNYKPLGTRSFDDFILEYAKQGRDRGWEVTFGFTAPPPATMSVDYFVYNPTDIRIEPCDVLQTSFHSVFEKPILNLKRSGVAKKLTVIDHSSGEGPKHGLLTPMRMLRGRAAGRTVDAVVAVSEFIARRDRERVFLPKDKMYVVHNGIDLARFPFRLRTDADAKSIVYVGQLTVGKGVRTLVRAMRSGADSIQLAGTGPLESELVAGNINLLGHVADVPALFRSAAIVIVPSEWAEAFGLVVIEAMASGAAVVASDAGALPEVVGDAGLIFRAGDEADLTAKLNLLLNDAELRRELARRGRERVESHFQLHDCVRKHLDIVDSLQ